jgi:hypothetical protein
MMLHEELLAMGAPIATDIIEGARRHLIDDRTDLTGARWHGHFHEAVEAFRNHRSRYEYGKVPSVATPTRGAHLRGVTSVE